MQSSTDVPPVPELATDSPRSEDINISETGAADLEAPGLVQVQSGREDTDVFKAYCLCFGKRMEFQAKAVHGVFDSYVKREGTDGSIGFFSLLR